MQIIECLNSAAPRLQQKSDTPRLDAEILLAHVLEQSRTWLHTWPEKQLDEPAQQQFRQLLERRIQGEPVAHLVGHQEFWSLDLLISPATLIPRPETELLVELALEHIPLDVEAQILDLGTGSGALALALAHERPHSQITATDQSVLALEIARQNASKHNLANVDLLEGQWFLPLGDTLQFFDVIVSNPPYIVENDPHLQQGDVAYEPVSALAAGVDGLDDIRHIIRFSPDHLKPGGWLLLEHGYDQRQTIIELLAAQGFDNIEVHDDYAGIPRIACGQFNH